MASSKQRVRVERGLYRTGDRYYACATPPGSRSASWRSLGTVGLMEARRLRVRFAAEVQTKPTTATNIRTIARSRVPMTVRGSGRSSRSSSAWSARQSVGVPIPLGISDRAGGRKRAGGESVPWPEPLEAVRVDAVDKRARLGGPLDHAMTIGDEALALICSSEVGIGQAEGADSGNAERFDLGRASTDCVVLH